MKENTQITSPPEHKRFVKDMRAAGFKVRRHSGNEVWRGPAVRVASVQEAVSRTQVPCQWEQVDERFIVYPVQSGAYAW